MLGGKVNSPVLRVLVINILSFIDLSVLYFNMFVFSSNTSILEGVM